MSGIAYRARAIGPLGNVDWTIPQGVSVMVGPNRVGKSTLLRLPELVGGAAGQGIAATITRVFDGAGSLRNWNLPAGEPMSLGFRLGDLEWDTQIDIAGGAVVGSSEQLTRLGARLLWREAGSREIHGDGFRFPAPSRPIPAYLGGWATQTLVNESEVPEAVRDWFPFVEKPSLVELSEDECRGLLRLLTPRSFRTYQYEITHLLRFGSGDSSLRKLAPTGENLFPLLRSWRDRLDCQHRYDFVLETMREIFVTLGRVGFEQAGQTVTMTVADQRWPAGKSVPINRESTGFITALLQLCAVASTGHGQLITLDEIETSLHPRAIRVLIEAMRRWADEHQLRIVLATQSETVLDQFRDDPSRVFVLEPKQERSPVALTELFSPEYLSQFSLGDLFAHLEFGGDVEPGT